MTCDEDRSPSRTFRGEYEMRKVFVIVMLGAGVLAASFLPPYSSRVAAAPQSTAVFDADGKLKRPEGYRHWVFVGAPLTPNGSAFAKDAGLNNGKANFPEYHRVYVE